MVLICLAYIIGLSLIIWAQMRLEIVNNFDFINEAGMIPWYTYPLLLGVFGFITIIGLFKYKSIFQKDKHIIAMLLISALIFIGLGRILTYINTQTTLTIPFWEVRTVYWTRLVLIIVSAYVVTSLLTALCTKLKKDQFIRCRKRFLRAVLVGIIITTFIFATCASALLKIDYWTNYTSNGLAGEGGITVSDQELEAINYLRLNANPYAQSIALTTKSWEIEKLLGGIPNVFDRPSIFFNATQPLFLFQTLATQDYIYLPQRDQGVLNHYTESYLKSNVMPYLPVAFNNSDVVIYKIPPLAPPNGNSDLALVTSGTGFKSIDNNISDWVEHAQSGTIENLTSTSRNKGFTLSGYLNQNDRDFYLVSLPIVDNTNTTDFPIINIRWRSTDSCATFEVKYTDGTYLTQFADASKIISQSLPDWTITKVNQPLNKTMSQIILGIDDRTHTNVTGFQSVSLDYITLQLPQSTRLTPTNLLAAAGFDYATVSDQDPSLLNYPTLMLTSDIAVYDLTDAFSTGLSHWTIGPGNWSVANGELQQAQRTPYIDAIATTGNPSWMDYSISIEAKTVGAASDDLCLQFRYQDPKNTYDFRLQSGLLRVGKFVNGSWIQLANSTSYKVNGDTWYKLGISAQGNRIQCFLNDQQVFNVVDSTYSSGKVALRTEGIAAAFDNFSFQTSDRLAQFNRYVDAVKNGSDLVVLGDQNLGYFASLMKLTYGNQTTADSIRIGNFTVSIPSTTIPTLYSTVNTQTLGIYLEGNTSKSSFALSTNIGDGKLIYVNYSPIQEILDTTGSNWTTLSNMGTLISQVSDAQPADVSALHAWNYDVAQDITLNGAVILSTTQLPFGLTGIQTDNITIIAANSKPIQIVTPP